MIRAIIFDLDDTLYPEAGFVHSGYKAVSDAVNRRWGFEIYDELVDLFQAGHSGDRFTPVLKRHMGTVSESYVKELVEVYRGHEPQITPFPETREILDTLRATHDLALISDGYLDVQARKLDALEMRYYFEPVIFTDTWGRDFWKPHPRAFEECARLLALDPAAMVYVGDNPSKDFVAPKKMGMRTVRVRRPGTLHHREDHPPELEADDQIASLAELPALLPSFSR